VGRRRCCVRYCTRLCLSNCRARLPRATVVTGLLGRRDRPRAARRGARAGGVCAAHETVASLSLSLTTASGWMDPVGVASWQLGRRRWECGVPPGLRLRADRSHSTAVQFVLLNQWTRLVSSSSHLFWFGFSAVTRIFSQLVLGNPTIYWHTLILQPSKGLFGYSYPMWIG
jgi:hypothetical protein